MILNKNLTNNQINTYETKIRSKVSSQVKAITELEIKNQELAGKQRIQMQQLKEIEDKEKLLLTRSRMLQISQDRNSYKSKIIYLLFVAIFIIIIIILILYTLFKNKPVIGPMFKQRKKKWVYNN
jgi:hypothetical protein